ncbi:MAG: hypothetical protein HC846_03560 [Blastocatellia bacterium]|nr:hypothetical protein [Blastocatellia bacterium]
MGVVYLASRNDDFRKRVAIKLVKGGLDSKEVLRRFKNERQILASLQHPNIAQLLDGGTTGGRCAIFCDGIHRRLAAPAILRRTSAFHQ